MAFTFHAVTVPVVDQMLTALDKVLDKALAYAAARKFAQEVLLGCRLYPDMLPLSRQVQLATDHGRNSVARLAGMESLKLENTETTIEQLKARIARSLAFIRAIDPANLAGSEERIVTYPQRGQDVQTPGGQYFLHVAMPNFFFHVTTAYDILRHNGVDIGKRDFLGTA